MEGRITISPRVGRRTYFAFRDLCHAHGIPVEKGINQALRRALEQAGVDLKDIESGSPDDKQSEGLLKQGT